MLLLPNSTTCVNLHEILELCTSALFFLENVALLWIWFITLLFSGYEKDSFFPTSFLWFPLEGSGLFFLRLFHRFNVSYSHKTLTVKNLQ